MAPAILFGGEGSIAGNKFPARTRIKLYTIFCAVGSDKSTVISTLPLTLFQIVPFEAVAFTIIEHWYFLFMMSQNNFD
jgi:hypothetical protein